MITKRHFHPEARFGSASRGITMIACLALIAVVAVSPASAQKASENDTIKKALQMEPMGLEADLKKVEEQWAAIEAHLTGADHIKIRNFKVSWWSVGQQTMHIAKVINLMGQQIEVLLADPTIGAEEKALPLRGVVLAAGALPRGVAKAPEAVQVRTQPTLAEVRAEIKEARRNWAKVAKRKDEIAKSPSKFPHFALGPMTSADWVRFIAIHTAHHLKIVEDILPDKEPDKKPAK